MADYFFQPVWQDEENGKSGLKKNEKAKIKYKAKYYRKCTERDLQVQTLEPMYHVKIQARSPIPNKLEVPGKKDKVLKPWTTTSTSALALVVLLEGLTTDEEEIITWS